MEPVIAYRILTGLPSYLNGFIFRYWSKGSNTILLEYNSDNRVTYIYVSVGMDI